MSSIAPGELRILVNSKTISAIRSGQTISGRVIDQAGELTILEVLGQRVEVQLPQQPELGSTITLRVLDVSNGTIEAQVAANPFSQVRRLVDAAATRIFGGVVTRPNAPKIHELSPQATLRVAVRGDRPLQPLVSFEPEALAASAALASASSEELLAALAALERLEVPATPLTIAAALPEANAPGRLVAVLSRVSDMLALLTPEARLTTLRTLAEYLSHIQPGVDALESQISSFVDQIANGGERKLYDLLTALAQRSESDAVQRLFYTARATERATSLTHDIKTQLLAVSNAQNESSTLAGILTEALEVVTAAQLTSLNAARTSPGAIAFVLPIVADRSTLAALVTVQRDTPEGPHRRLDAANFRMSFSLETRRLGNVRIDIEAVARAIRVTVEAQTTYAAEILRSGLEQLSVRLEGRGFRSVAMTAQVVRRPPYRPEGSPEEQRTYVQSLRVSEGEMNPSVHLDTRA